MTAPITSGGAPSAADYSGLTGVSAPGGAMGKNEFMKLLITQMTHQDPLNPQDSAQMASQLAQFSALEQMTNINTAIKGQADAAAALAGSVNNSSAIALLGRTVTAISDQVVGGPAGTKTVDASIPAGGGLLSVRIVDASGRTLVTKDLGAATAGRRSADIEGLTGGLPEGTYTVAFDLTDGAGVVTHPASLLTAKIDGIRFGTNGAMVSSGPLSIPIGSIVSVQ